MSSATQAVRIGRGARCASTDDGPFQFGRGQVGPGVEELQERIAALVGERQRMRISGASRASLEWNRVQLVRGQWQLSHALIDRHLQAPTESTH